MGDSETFLDPGDLNQSLFSGKKSGYEQDVSLETRDSLTLIVEIVGHDIDTVTNS